MKEKFSTKSEQLLRQMTNSRINESRTEFGAKNLHVGGRYYKIATVLSYITAIYGLIVFLAQLIGAYFSMLDFKIYNEDKFSQAQNDLRNCAIISVLLLVAIIALVIKKRFLYSIISLVFTVFYFVNSTFAQIITSKAEITRLIIFIPAIGVMTACAVYLLVTHIIDRIEYRRAYTKLVDKIIATYPNTDGEMTTEKQWEHYIEQYNEPTVHERPKKSLRIKNRKVKAESNTSDNREENND